MQAQHKVSSRAPSWRMHAPPTDRSTDGGGADTHVATSSVVTDDIAFAHSHIKHKNGEACQVRPECWYAHE